MKKPEQAKLPPPSKRPQRRDRDFIRDPSEIVVVLNDGGKAGQGGSSQSGRSSVISVQDR